MALRSAGDVPAARSILAHLPTQPSGPGRKFLVKAGYLLQMWLPCVAPSPVETIHV